MSSRTVLALNASAFVCSSALVGLAIAAIVLASDAYDAFTWAFPQGSYGWQPSHWFGDGRTGFNIRIGYDRSSEIKTYFAATSALIVGLLGTLTFGLSFKPPTAPLLIKSLTAGAALACIVATTCAVWSAVAEVEIKESTCWFEPAIADHQYSCSIENAACNAMRFTDEVNSWQKPHSAEQNYEVLDKACLQFRHARFMVIPLAVFSLLLAGLYAALVWLGPRKSAENGADARVRALQQDD